jgi:hypothetical protein
MKEFYHIPKEGRRRRRPGVQATVEIADGIRDKEATSFITI